jgi:hypothetical protein
VYGNKCLDAPSASSGARIRIWPCTGGANQQCPAASGNDTLTITSRAGGGAQQFTVPNWPSDTDRNLHQRPAPLTSPTPVWYDGAPPVRHRQEGHLP